MQQLAEQTNTSTMKKYYPAIRQDAYDYAGRILKNQQYNSCVELCKFCGINGKKPS
jgi:uncharacterized Fe-S radical SAM superfamily protein PflX